MYRGADMYNKLVQVALLYDFYGQLLTDKQRDIVDMYYNNDLSLGEISEQKGISRQGVHDSLKRAEKTLNNFEEKLGLVNRFLEEKESLKKTIEMLDEILVKNVFNEEDIKESINNIKEYVSRII